jgi:hypothetical protein
MNNQTNVAAYSSGFVVIVGKPNVKQIHPDQQPSRSKNCRCLIQSADHPICHTRCEMEFSNQPLFSQYCPRGEMFLFIVHNILYS